jgi:hypothetical protein
MNEIAHIIGLGMVVASLLVFVLLCPRQGRVNPLLAGDFAQQIMMMIMVAAFATGAMLAMGGAPPGMLVAR